MRCLNEVLANNELYHYGVKGQKWGVRRYQNADGTWTDEGKKRRRQSIPTDDETDISPVNKPSSSVEKSAELLNRYYSIEEKNTKLGAIRDSIPGLTLLGKSDTERYINTYGDYVVPKGTPVYNIGSRDTGPIYDMMWGSHTDSDNVLYTGAYGSRLSDKGKNKVYRTEFVANKDIKVADRKVGGDALWEYYNDNDDNKEDFWKRMDRESQKHNINRRSYNKLVEAYNQREKNPQKWEDALKTYGYDLFNISMTENYTDQTMKDGSVYTFKGTEAYNDILKKKGYSGILDINDMTYSTYDSELPVIYIDRGKDLVKKETVELSNKDIHDAANKVMLKRGYSYVDRFLSNSL